MEKKDNILNTVQFYSYLLKKIDADMVEKGLSSYKIRNKKESGYFISSSTYDNIKLISKGKSDSLLNNKKLKTICKELNIKVEIDIKYKLFT